MRLSLDRWLLTAFGRYAVDAIGYVEHARRLYACRELLWDVATEFLRRGTDVILDDGFFLRGDRVNYLARARDLGARGAIHFVDTPVGVLRGRLTARNRDPGGHHFEITPEALDVSIAIFEPPSPDEGAELIVVRGTEGTAPT